MHITLTTLQWLLPWEFSPTVLVCCTVAVVLFARGVAAEKAAGRRTGWARQLSFYLGAALLYVPLQTRFDYLAQHMFWIHRLQHLLLHHLGPFFVALGTPWSLMIAGLPANTRTALRNSRLTTAIRKGYRNLQQPLLAYVLFVGLIAFWLWPSVHFNAMLSARDYRIMNWSMAVDGLLFWWLLLDPRARDQGARIGFGARIGLLLLSVPPQLVMGAILAMHKETIYEVYAVCGRLWPIDPVVDQQLGGLIVWIPPAMMSVIATLIIWRNWMYNDHRLHGQVIAPSTADPSPEAAV